MGREIMDLIQAITPVAGTAAARWRQYSREKARLLPLALPGERDALCRLLAERLEL